MSDIERCHAHTEFEKVCLTLKDSSEDYSAPHVKLLFNHYSNETIQKFEILFLLIYLLALESGFVATQEYQKCQENLEKVSPIAIFHLKNLLQILQTKPIYKISAEGDFLSLDLHNLLMINTPEQEHILTNLLTAAVLDDNLIVSLTPKNDTSIKGFSVFLNMDHFVQAEEKVPKPILSRLMNLEELEKKVRDEVLVPRLNQFFRLLGYNQCAALEGLPYHIYDNICQYLTRNDIAKLAHVSATLFYSCVKNKYYLEPNRFSIDSQESVSTIASI